MTYKNYKNPSQLSSVTLCQLFCIWISIIRTECRSLVASIIIDVLIRFEFRKPVLCCRTKHTRQWREPVWEVYLADSPLDLDSLSINYSYYRPEEYSWQVDSIYGRQEYCINSLISWVSDSYLFPCRSSRLDYGNLSTYLRCVDSSFSCMQRCFRLFVNTLLVPVVFGRGICVGNPYSMTYIYTAYYEINTRSNPRSLIVIDCRL